MTYICYRGIEVSANMQKGLLAIEAGMLVVFAIVALLKVATGHAGPTHIDPSWSWFNPFNIPSVSAFVAGLILMIFIYWGWDTAVTVNEETKDPAKTPGRAAVISTVLLLAIYAVVILAAQSFAGVGTHGIGLSNPDNSSDVLNVLGRAVFGNSWIGTICVKLLLLMVLSSAAASTQTTILPTARTSLAMAVYRAIPTTFAKIHKKYLTPTNSTIAMGLISAVLYVVFNYVSGGEVISDSVTACGVFIALYYGTTGFACAWWYRKTLTKNTRDLFMQGIIPVTGGVILFVVLGWSLYLDWLNPYAEALQPGGSQLHRLADDLPAALGDRRRRGARCRRRDRRPRRDGHLQPGAAGVLPRRGAEQEHPDPGARDDRCAGRLPAADRARRRAAQRAAGAAGARPADRP